MSLKGREKVHNWLIGLFNDPLVKILLENSHFTKKQLEVLLIDVLSEQFFEKKMSFEDKSLLRLSPNVLSRGAFSGTLHQSRSNMQKSIFTIMLMGYLGLIESPSLEPFIIASNKIKNYLDYYIKNEKKHFKDFNLEKGEKNLSQLQNELKESLYNLIVGKKSIK